MNSESQQWWEYHLRTARGESLTEDEQAIYDAGIEQFDQEEAEELQFSALDNLRQLRLHVQTLTQTLTQITTHSESLNSQISELELAYQQLTGYSLMLDAHAPS